MKGHKCISLNASEGINCLLWNLKRRVQGAPSTTFVKIMYYYVFKYQFPLVD
jgi:hypothetical protein